MTPVYEGKGPKDPGVAAPLTAAGCRGNCWYNFFTSYFSDLCLRSGLLVLCGLSLEGRSAEEDRGRQTGIVMNSLNKEQGQSALSCGSR